MELIKSILFGRMLEALPQTPHKGFWSDGESILCETEDACNVLANLLESMFPDASILTGFYDPEEDEKNGIHDSHTGFYYVTVD